MKLKSRESLLALIIFCIFTVRALTYTSFEDSFGAEYGFIATSIIEGNGFSNPFKLISSDRIITTAWSNPAYVSYYVAIFSIFGVKSITSFWVLVFSRAFLMTLSCYLLLKLDKRPLFQITVFLLWCFYSFMLTYENVYDISLNIFLTAISIYAVVGIAKRGMQNEFKIILISLAIILPLANIGLTLGLMISLLVLALTPGFRTRGFIKYSVSSIIIILAIYGMWGYRNYSMMNKFIPFKSNLWFEFCISNVISETGLVGRSYWQKFHPYFNEELTRKYEGMGEVAFLNEYKEKSVGFIKEHPGEYFRKVIRRGINASLFTENYVDRYFVSDKISDNDNKLLIEHGLVVNDLWHVLDVSEDHLMPLIHSLPLEDPSLITSEIKRIKTHRESRKFYKGSLLSQIHILLLTLIPTISIILSFFIPSIRRNRLFQFSLIFYMTSIGIYVAVSHYERYQFFHVAQAAIFNTLFLTYVICIFSPKLVASYKKLRLHS